MPRNYQTVSDGVRQTIIKSVIEEGKPQIMVSRTLNVKKSTINRIIKKYREDGVTVACKKGGNRPTLLDDEMKKRIIETINDDCTISVDGIIKKLNLEVHSTTVWRWLKKINYSWKLIRPFPVKRNDPDVKSQRKSYCEWYQTVDPLRKNIDIIYIGESSFNLHMMRVHDRRKKEITTNSILPINRGYSITMFLALNCNNIINAEALLTPSVNSQIFKEFMTKLLTLLEREREYIVVMGNVSFCQSDDEFYESYPYKIMWLPRYSPFLDPCEECFSELKSIIRRDGPLQGSKDLISRMVEACKALTPKNLAVHINYPEQFLQQCVNEEDI
ncbi:hypothetical protein RF11_15376 [Thelohanellus kitauei]|uniref:Uncharacterized protein n=1 Tax=Thelohanellus kitauei TaxID=669202 RepID=A0A0C2M7C5_THEKT|nr:hypothetical protein RF11_15376 [Thelohanellus kitauei]